MTQSVKNDMRATDRPFFLPINQFQIWVSDLGNRAIGFRSRE
jgi:hypothetical protein